MVEKVCDTRYKKALAWRTDLIKQLEMGVPLGVALRHLNIKENTYAAARARKKDWAAEVDAAKVRGRRLIEAQSYLKNTEGEQATDENTHSLWVAKYLGMTHNADQLRIAHVLDECAPGEVSMVLLYPEAGKSTSVLNWATRRLSVDPNERIAIVSEGQPLARKFVGRIKQRFTDAAQFTPLITRYGPFYEPGQERDNKPWSADYIRVQRCSHDEADYSLQAMGWRSSAYGTRIDTLIIDDVQSRKSLNQTQEILDNLRQTYFTRGKEMRIVIVGTRVGIGDVYEAFLDSELVDHLVQMPAMTADGEPRCPEAFTYGKRTPRANLEAIRKRVGEAAWFASYQQNPLSNELSTFGPYLERCFDHERTFGPINLKNAA